jgi:hypothetical protein
MMAGACNEINVVLVFVPEARAHLLEGCILGVYSVSNKNIK